MGHNGGLKGVKEKKNFNLGYLPIFRRQDGKEKSPRQPGAAMGSE